MFKKLYIVLIICFGQESKKEKKQVIIFAQDMELGASTLENQLTCPG